ncbi:hypothetical protein VaNZ11_008026 [Volvox africanus]|uniref:tRNA-uridine aminocarboxypropyltransferase n=1 Tax=Volvox africanus TaxID=51714 RepID=A0ABQ5S4W9_9CHLO|nr:hypothetical protein VaNZ11_008026 [Volvox africanus]
MDVCTAGSTNTKYHLSKIVFVSSVRCCCAASRPSNAGQSIPLLRSNPSLCLHQAHKTSPPAPTAYHTTGTLLTSHNRGTSVQRRYLPGARWPRFDPTCSRSNLFGTIPQSPRIRLGLRTSYTDRLFAGSQAAAMATALTTIQLATANEENRCEAAATSRNQAAVDTENPEPNFHGSLQVIVPGAAVEAANGGSRAAESSEPVQADAGGSGSHAQPDDSADQLGQTRDPDPRSKPSQKSKSKSRLAKTEDLDELDEPLVGVNDTEEELVSKLMQQLKGLSHKQQKLYGIWDGTHDGGKRAFVDQWRRRHSERRAMVEGLRDPARAPTERMSLRTSYILRWRKILFSCPNCWLLPGLCVCGRMRKFTLQRTRVVVHAHHGEWGSASNSGCILPTSLEGSEILLYGHPDHDVRLREILNDTTCTTALLWPGANSLLPEQLNALAEERTGGRITIVALDATWGNARRMQGWFPEETLTVRLPPESTLKENKLSLLRPVRRYRGDLESGRVSTVEAVATLLYELEGDEAMYRGLLDNLKIKVDACRLQKNRTLVYDTHNPEPRSTRHRWRGGGAVEVEGRKAGEGEGKADGGTTDESDGKE